VVPPDPHIEIDPADEELAERGRALIAAAVAETSAPLGLRERIEADRQRAGSPRAASRRRWGVFAPVAAVVAAAIVAVVLVTGGSGAPSVLATASLAAKGPILPAPEENTQTGATLKAAVEGTPFPYWGDSFQWEAVGARDDKIKGRKAKTVYYRNDNGVRAAYTILGGDAIDHASGAHKVNHNGTKLWVTTKDGRRIVTWQRNGHTCVMSAPASLPAEKLFDLASWKGGGRVSF
jgi:anti-sigma factor RsiW